MAVIFKITFAVLALCAVAYALPAEVTKTEISKDLSEGVHTVVGPVQTAENKAHEQHAEQTSIVTEEAHSRHKRGCKTITYKKGGRTITGQKC